MPSDTLHKLYENYFTPHSHGYKFVLNFYTKYSRELSGTEFNNFDSFLNHIFLNMSAIDFSQIEGPEEHYVIKTMYYQCWNTIYALKRDRRFMISDSSTAVNTDEGASQTKIETAPSGDPGPAEYLDASDLFSIVQIFKTTLKRKDVRILNALIDEKPLQETADSMRMEYNALCVKIKRLREKLARFLKEGGYVNEVTKNFLKKNQNKL